MSRGMQSQHGMRTTTGRRGAALRLAGGLLLVCACIAALPCRDRAEVKANARTADGAAPRNIRQRMDSLQARRSMRDAS